MMSNFLTSACVFYVAHRPHTSHINNVGQSRLQRSRAQFVRRDKCFHALVASGCLGPSNTLFSC